jgi:hypothetical protein
MGLLYLMGESALNPRTLFANNEQGLWLDPSQMSTLYQDSNGVTPCTAAGDPVGLILDQSRGGLGALGPELVPDPTLTSTTGWVFDAGWSASSGNIVGDNAAAGTQIFASSPEILTQGKWYVVEVEITSYTGSGGVRLDCRPTSGGTGSTNHATLTSVGTHRTIINNTGANTRLGLQIPSNVSPLAVTITRVSVKEIPGNHAYQTTSGARPTLARIPSSGRRNLLTRTEEFNNAAWTKLQCSISANNSAAPDGTATADLIVEDSATAARYVNSSLTTTVQSYTFSVYLKNPSSNGRRYALLYHNESVKGWVFDLQSGVVGTGGTTAVGAPAAYGIESVGNGWYRCYITVTGTAASNSFRVYPVSNSGSGNASYTGDGVSGILVWGAQLETGSSATNYQKVVATTDVTESGFNDLWHLVFDGSDDSLVTNSVDFSGTDEMTVIAGVRKVDTTARMICELSTNATSSAGAFYLLSGQNATDGWWSQSKGDAVSVVGHSANISTIAVETAVISTTHDISGDLTTIRRNAVAGSDATADKGSGNFRNDVLYIGRRASSSLPYNGHLYQLIVRGKTTPTGKLLEAERFTARKTGVSF